MDLFGELNWSSPFQDMKTIEIFTFNDLNEQTSCKMNSSPNYNIRQYTMGLMTSPTVAINAPGFHFLGKGPIDELFRFVSCSRSMRALRALKKTRKDSARVLPSNKNWP
jgi:hypothetical protein